MASIPDNSFFKGVSGSLGQTVILKKYRKRTILSAMPRKPRKRSAAQKANSEKFKLAAKACKSILRDPEIKNYFGRKAAERGQASPYIAALKDYLCDPAIFSKEYILEQARKPMVIDEPKNDGTMTMEIKVVTANGDVIAQGFAVQIDTSNWKYKAPITDLAVIIKFTHAREQS